MKTSGIWKQVFLRVTLEEPRRPRHGKEWTRPLRVLSVQCPLQTSPITQPWIRHIHTAVPVPHSV